MSTVTSQTKSFASSSQIRDEPDVEPDKAWKDALKQKIEDGMNSMVEDAKKNLSDQLAKAPVSVEERERLTAEYHDAMNNIRALATEAFRDELERERQERRWATGQPLPPHWNEALKKEQQDIMDAITSQKEAASSKSRPTDPPPSDVRPPEAAPPAPPPPVVPTGPIPLELPPALAEKEKERKRERERERGPPPGPHILSRRGSNTHSASSKDDQSAYRRPPYLPPPMVGRPKPLDPVLSDGSSDVDEEVMLRPPERQEPIRKPSVHERPPDLPTNRSIDRSRPSSERHVARSPSKPIPQIWMPPIQPEEDILTSRSQSGLARRGSTASIRSTGSANVRPTIAEPIPERVEAEPIERERIRTQEADQTWTPTQRAREKEKQGSSMRNESRYSSASDMSQRYEEPASYASPRTPLRPDASGPPVSSNRRPVNRKTSFNSEDPEFYPASSAQQRSVRSRGSFNSDDRGYPYPSGPSSRPNPRTPSTPNDDRERFYEPPHPRPYPTPPSSVSRSTGREYSYGPEAYESYNQEPRSATWRAAQLPESPPKRRTSDSRPTFGREPSFPKYAPRQAEELDFPEDVYARRFDSPPSASIPIVRPRQSPSVELPSWKSWGQDPPMMCRDSQREHEHYARDYDGADLRHDYHVRDPDVGEREYEYYVRSRDHGPPYAPPEMVRPSRRERHSVRSPPSSYQGSQYDRTTHQFGGREARDTVEEDSEEYYEESEPEEHEESEESEEEQELPPDAIHQSDVRSRQNEQARKELELSAKRKARGEREQKAKEEARWVNQEKAKHLEELKRQEQAEEREREEEAKKAKERKEEASREKRRKDEEEKARKLVQAQEEETMRQQEAAEAIRKAAEAKRLAKEAKKNAAEARKLEEEARKLEEEAKERAEEIKRTQEEYRKKEENIKRKEEETKKKAEQLRRQEEASQKKEREVLKKEQEAKQKEQEAKKKAEDARRKEKEAEAKEAEAKRKELEARKREEEAQQKEEETKKKEEEIRQREEDLKKREDELSRREEEISRTAAEKLQKEWDQEEQDRKSKEVAAEMKRLEQERRRQADDTFRKDQERIRQDQLQQEEFRKREEEIRRRAEERKRQDSVGAESNWKPSSYSSQPSSSPGAWSFAQAPAPNAADKPTQGASPSSWNSNGPSPWASQARATSTTSSTAGQTASSASKPRSGSTGSTLPTNPSPNPPPPRDEAEWKRRLEEQFIKQQEQFRREQERLEAARQAREMGKILTKEDVIAVYERHEHLWQQVIPNENELRWRQFPWPMFKAPSSPEDITFAAINAYMQSPHYPEKDKARTQKDRLKDQLKRWHPDRFETKLLPKVMEVEREMVKEGAGSVVRTLNDLLTRSNVASNVFS